MTRTEITQEMQKLTEDIQTLSSSRTKAAAEQILQLQQRRRELRAQLEAAAPSGATADTVHGPQRHRGSA
jgi:DNA-binding protein H-NS